MNQKLALITLLIAHIGHSKCWSQQSRKIAFVVGVSEYQKDGLTNLNYAHKDANDLAGELGKHDFEVTKLIGKSARHKSVSAKLATFLSQAKELGKNDVVLVSFSGHGVQKLVTRGGRRSEIPFFCVYDSLVTDPDTMISLCLLYTSPSPRDS